MSIELTPEQIDRAKGLYTRNRLCGWSDDFDAVLEYFTNSRHDSFERKYVVLEQAIARDEARRK